MSGGVSRLVDQIERTRAELSDALSEPDVAADRGRYADLTRRYAGLEEAALLAARWRDAAGRVGEAREMLADDDDEDIRALLKEAEGEVAELEPLIRQAMVEPDPMTSGTSSWSCVPVLVGRRRRSSPAICSTSTGATPPPAASRWSFST
jgi:protein subunit release factor A